MKKRKVLIIVLILITIVLSIVLFMGYINDYSKSRNYAYKDNTTIVPNGTKEILGNFYSDNEVYQIVKERYGSDIQLLSKTKEYWDVSYPWTHNKDRFYKYVYLFSKGNISFEVYSYCALPGFEGNIDYEKSIKTNYFHRLVLKLKENKFLNDLDYGINEDSDFYINLSDYADIEKASKLIEEIRKSVSKDDDTYVRVYYKNSILFNSSLTKYEEGDVYYVDREFIEREYVNNNRRENILKKYENQNESELNIDKNLVEKYKPEHAVIGSKIYGWLDLKSNDYLVEWNRRVYDAGSPKTDIIASELIEFAGGEVTYLDDNTLKWKIGEDQFEMNMTITENKEPQQKNQEYYKYKKVSKNKYECKNKIYEYKFQKNNTPIDIEIADVFTYQRQFYGNIKIYMSDVEKLINRKIIIDYKTGQISF